MATRSGEAGAAVGRAVWTAAPESRNLAVGKLAIFRVSSFLLQTYI